MSGLKLILYETIPRISTTRIRKRNSKRRPNWDRNFICFWLPKSLRFIGRFPLYDYKKIVDEFLPLSNRSADQIRDKIKWSARKEKKMAGNVSAHEPSGLLAKRKLNALYNK